MDALHHSILNNAICFVKQGGVTLDSDEQELLKKHNQDLCDYSSKLKVLGTPKKNKKTHQKTKSNFQYT